MWPYLPGSSIKGALKGKSKHTLFDAFCKNNDNADDIDGMVKNLDKDVAATYGSMDGIGSFTVNDYSCLLFPVASFHGTAAWVTCPMAIERLKTLCRIADIALPQPIASWDLKIPTAVEIVKCSEGSAVCQDGKAILAELDLQTKVESEMSHLVQLLARITGLAENHLNSRLLIAHDDAFTFLVNNATEVRTRTALKLGRKNAEDKTLWQEECLPAGCVFVGYVAAHADSDLENGSTLQIGARTSTGTGLVKWLLHDSLQQ